MTAEITSDSYAVVTDADGVGLSLLLPDRAPDHVMTPAEIYLTAVYTLWAMANRPDRNGRCTPEYVAVQDIIESFVMNAKG
jgi:hypothetical protein